VVPQLVKKFAACCENRRFIAVFTVIRTCPHPDSAEYNTHRPILFKLHFNIILSSKPRSSKWFFPSGFLYVYLWGSIRAKFSILLILNDLITLTISCEE